MAFIESLPSKEGIRRLKKEAKSKSHKPRGRPVGWRKPKPEGEGIEVSYTTIRISKSLKDTINHGAKPKESTNDTIERIISDKGLRIMDLERENGQLKALIERLKVEQGVIINE